MADMPAAGKATLRLNDSAFAAYDPSRKSMMVYEAYTRPTRREASAMRQGLGESQAATWQALQYDQSAQWRPEQGTHTTRFHRGFARRHVSDINPSEQRQQSDAERAERQAAITEQRREYLVGKRTFRGSGYNILTGEETGGASKPMKLPQRRHNIEIDRSTSPGADKTAYRLRDSSARFHATAEEMLHRPERVAGLMREGLVQTQVRARAMSALGRARARIAPRAAASSRPRARAPPSPSPAEDVHGDWRGQVALPRDPVERERGRVHEVLLRMTGHRKCLAEQLFVPLAAQGRSGRCRARPTQWCSSS